MSTNIYEQAVAEAKKLREVAEQNAKNAIIEAITPRVRELIDRELSESSDTIEDIVLESSGYEDDDIILEESAILELAKEIAGDKKEKEDDKKKEESKDSDDDVVEMINRILNEEEDEEEKSSKSKKESHNNEDDMNLEELLNEIKMEIDFGEIEDDDIESALLELMPTVKMAAEEEMEAELDIETEDAGEEKEEEGEEKLDFSALMGDEGEEEPDEEAQEEPVEEMFSINEAALSRELKRLRNNRSSNSTNETQDLNESRYREQLLKEQRNNRELKGELDEYRGAIENLRDQLNEMNLFNAKLLYVNKLLQTKGLDSSQKKTIIESIDSADSLREVKLVYKTLSESVNKKSAGSLNETKIRKLASSSSRPMKSGGSLLNESSNQVNRWARLAGLK